MTRLSLRRGDNSLEPDVVELSGKVAIGHRVADRLEAEVLSPSVRLPLKDLTEEHRLLYEGLDGCTWILEVSTDTEYTMEDVWNPSTIGNMDPETLKEFDLPKVDTSAFIEFCTSILNITDMKVPEYTNPD